ncbi:hypothetical protein [Silvimonas sp.]|uniref:hypothetical protein n=1 Tax=Silvimonas sp. TaxID=2650811 RepID=UPI002851B677|nr:hypothetical protein [Silvimonas sp.]MDR3426914.1 hypothetical protein [Silvimonas sp.]
MIRVRFFAAFLALLIPGFLFASALPSGITTWNQTPSGGTFSTPSGTTWGQVANQTTPSRIGNAANGAEYLYNSEQRLASVANGASFASEVETGIAKADVVNILKNAVKTGKVTPAGIVGGIAATFIVGALIDQGFKWLDSAKDWEKNNPANGDPVCYLVNSDKTFCSGDLLANVTTYGQQRGNCPAGRVVTVPTLSVGQYGSSTCNGSTMYSIKAFQNPAYGTSTVPLTDADLDTALNAEMAAKHNATDWGHAFDDAAAIAPQTALNPDSPQFVSPATNPATHTVTNPDGSKSTSTTTTQTTTNAKPWGNTVNDTGIDATSSDTTTTTTTNPDGTTTTTTDSTPESKPTPAPTPEPSPVPPPDTTFPPVPPPTPVPDSAPSSQTGFLSWSPFATFAFTCTDPSMPILDKTVSIPLCTWIERIRSFFFWFWNVATAIGIYLLGRAFNINTASAKTEE